LPLIFVIMFDVITRKIDTTRLFFSEFTVNYGYSISTILQDLQWHFHAMLLMLTFGFGYLANAHVRVDIFREMLSKRRQAWMELICLIVLAVPFLGFMIVYGWDLMALSWHQGEGSDSMTGIDYRYVIKAFVPLGFLVAMFAVIATLLRLWNFFVRKRRSERIRSDETGDLHRPCGTDEGQGGRGAGAPGKWGRGLIHG